MGAVTMLSAALLLLSLVYFDMIGRADAYDRCLPNCVSSLSKNFGRGGSSSIGQGVEPNFLSAENSEGKEEGVPTLPPSAAFGILSSFWRVLGK